MTDSIQLESSKTAIAEKLMSGTTSIRKLSEEHHISKRSVSRYANKLAYHRPLYEGNGRPKVLDKLSMTVLQGYIDQIPQPSREDIIEQFLIEQKKSWCRLHHTTIDLITDEFGPKKMSARTILRYIRALNYKG